MDKKSIWGRGARQAMAYRLLWLCTALVFLFLCFGASSAKQKKWSVEVAEWGEGGALLYTLTRGSTVVCITNWGATITSFHFPDKNGKVADIVLGFDSVEPYKNGSSPYFGAIVGRVANRIGGASFSLNGKVYKLPANEPPNTTLHGGFIGFDKVLWQSAQLNHSDGPAVKFTYNSFDGEQGFPGDLKVTVVYKLVKENELLTEMHGMPLNKATPVSLAQHAYWNLKGHNSGDILSHKIQIFGSKITPVDKLRIPTGEFLPVAGTPFDFLKSRRIGKRIGEILGGYDHNYVLDGTESKHGLHLAARLKEPSSGRAMEVFTNAPGLQFYTGNLMVSIKGKGGFVYRQHDALCLETQAFPDAVNRPNFPSVIFSPPHVYRHVMLNRFYHS